MVFDITLQNYLSSVRVFFESTIHVHNKDRKIDGRITFQIVTFGRNT